jgi:RimJ/RimL family protein N-acetyltransferase
MAPSHDALALLRLHIEAGWDVRLPVLLAGDVTLLPGGSQAPWLLHASALADGTRVRCWRADVAEADRPAVAARAEAALALPVPVPTESGLTREVALCREAPPALDVSAAREIARPLTEADHALLEAFWPGEAYPYLDDSARGPLIGVVTEGRLRSLAHSSRRTLEACELGVETAPEARRQGYGLAVTVLWSEAVAAEGLVPVYSALAENTASLALAHAAGYRALARAAYVAG